MQQANRTKLCKLQNKSGGEDVYILYTCNMEPFTNGSRIVDYAGIFDHAHDARQVAECLTNIFSKLTDKHWKLSGKYSLIRYLDTGRVFEEYPGGNDIQGIDRRLFKYGVKGTFSATENDPELKSYKSEVVIGIPKSLKVLEEKQKAVSAMMNSMSKKVFKFKIIKYQTNDILPTMYFDDYNKTLHEKKFKHVINQLKDIPHAQANRQQLRHGARENLFEYNDSSDSEDDSNYTRFTSKSALGTKTSRSLLHTPTRTKKYTKKISTRR